MPSVDWNITGGRAVVEETRKIAAAQKDATEATKESGREVARLDGLAERVYKKNRSAAEQYRDGLRDLVQMEKTGRIGAELYTAERLRMGEALSKGTTATREQTAETRRLAAAEKEASRALRENIQERFRLRAEQQVQVGRQMAGEQEADRSQELAELRRSIQQRAALESAAQRQRVEVARQAQSELKAGRAAELADLKASILQRSAAQRAAVDQVQEQAARSQAAAAAIVDRNLSPLEQYKKSYRELIGVYKGSTLALGDKRREAMRLRRSLLEAGDAGKQAFGANAAAQARSYLGAIVGVGGVVSAITKDMSELDRMASDRAQAQRTVGQAERELRIGIAAESPEVREQIINTAEVLAGKQNLNRRLVYDTIRKSTSASPDALEGLKNAEASLSITAGTPGADAFAGAVGDIRGALGADDPDVAIGFALRSLTKARIESAPQLGKNLSRVLRFGKSADYDPKETAAVYNALNQGTADPQGELSRTAGIQLLRQLGDFFQGEVQDGKFDKTAVDDLSEQIGVLQTRGTLRKRFLDDASFESGALGAVRSLLRGNDASINQAYRRTLTGLDTDLGAVGREARQFIDSSSLQRGDKSNRVIEELDESYKVRSPVIISQENEVRLADSRFRALRESGQSAFPTSSLLPFLDRTLIGASQRIEAGADITDEEAIQISRRTLRQLEFKQQEYGAPAGPEYRALLDATEKLERIVSSSLESAEAQKAIAAALSAPPANLQTPREE